jgi:hypothetical protein
MVAKANPAIACPMDLGINKNQMPVTAAMMAMMRFIKFSQYWCKEVWRTPNYKGKGSPFGVGKTLGDVSVPLT